MTNCTLDLSQSARNLTPDAIVISEPLSAPQPSAPALTNATPLSKAPRPVLPEQALPHPIYAFTPNRDTLGGTAYLIVHPAGNLLIDSPAWDEVTQSFLQSQGGVRWLFLTHRGAMGKVREIQEALHCDVIVQEQEAYLLPKVKVTPFQQTFEFPTGDRAIWTSGHSPGSACLYHPAGGGILFSGRHLLPDRHQKPAPLRTSKTFHWPRQLRNIQTLIKKFSPETLAWICPGASTGYLRGATAIGQAYSALTALDFSTLQQMPPGL
ncbi:MBL fold metallo-hydrolase [Alkalinema pantanalense CENA528]|uniref:MBL fold metallo-hydrolase n=1 Tax=Alkalinema pantanalense TaxID=1620705 RepID=UPI003D6F5D72